MKRMENNEKMIKNEEWTACICGLTLAEKQVGYPRTVDNDSDDSDWERSAFGAFNLTWVGLF